MTLENDNPGIPLATEHTAHECDVQQIERALQLAIVQIDMSLRESGESVEQMIASITSMSARVNDIRKAAESQGSDESLLSECASASSDFQQALIAFQFYDRLTQRFDHVMQNLSEIINVISAPDAEHDVLWEKLKSRMRRVYSLEQEQVMFNALIEGSDIGKPADTSPAGKAANVNTDIELF